MHCTGGRESLQALKRRLEGRVDAPRPAAPAVSADAAEDLCADEGSNSFDVDVLHDDETGGDDALSTCVHPRIMIVLGPLFGCQVLYTL